MRHRLNRLDNRRVNMFFHQIVLTQARRALKRLLVRRVFRAWSACFETNIERVAA